MAPVIAPTRNPYAPQVPPRRPETVRGVVAPTLPPRRPDTATAPRAATIAPRPHSALQPVAYAMSQYQEPGDPFTAAAQGWVNAAMARDGQDAADAQVSSVIEGLSAHPDLAKYVQSGAMKTEDALRIASERDENAKASEATTARKAQITQRLTEMGYDDLAADFESGIADEDAIYDAVQKRVSPERKAPPAGYRYTENGDLEAIPGGPADKPAGERKLTAAEIKELFEAQDGVTAGEAVTAALTKALTLNETAWDGPIADIGTQAGALFGDANSADTQELKNLVMAQALDQLKAVFGGMPTEGERKILIEIQGSVNQPREVRKRIFERAIEAAERRIRENKAKAEGIQTGEYRNPGYDPTGASEPAADAGPAPEGVDQDVWSEMTAEERALWQ